jgi:hypothetical protein
MSYGPCRLDPGAAVVIADNTVIGGEVGGDRVVHRWVKMERGQHDEWALAALLPVDLDPSSRSSCGTGAILPGG